MTSHHFWSGYLVALAATAALYFVKYWRATSDRLFLTFAGAFALLGANWAVLAFSQTSDETRHYLYVIRLLAFSVIVLGIFDKNRGR
jgi:Na+/melibiose symporter-like transporter